MSKELNIYQKLNNFRMAVEGLRKDKKGYGYKYADINQVIKVITQPLSDVGLIDVDTVEIDENGQAWLRTDLIDIDNPESKLSIKSPLLLKDPSNPQALGSALTYNRRYNRVTLLGLEQEDDDGNAAAGRTAPQQNYPKPKHQPQDVKKEFLAFIVNEGIDKNHLGDFTNWMRSMGYELTDDKVKEGLLKQDVKLKQMIRHYLDETQAVNAMGG